MSNTSIQCKNPSGLLLFWDTLSLIIQISWSLVKGFLTLNKLNVCVNWTKYILDGGCFFEIQCAGEQMNALLCGWTFVWISDACRHTIVFNSFNKLASVTTKSWKTLWRVIRSSACRWGGRRRHSGEKAERRTDRQKQREREKTQERKDTGRPRREKRKERRECVKVSV